MKDQPVLPGWHWQELDSIFGSHWLEQLLKRRRGVGIRGWAKGGAKTLLLAGCCWAEVSLSASPDKGASWAQCTGRRLLHWCSQGTLQRVAKADSALAGLCRATPSVPPKACLVRLERLPEGRGSVPSGWMREHHWEKGPRRGTRETVMLEREFQVYDSIIRGTRWKNVGNRDEGAINV